MQSLFSIGYTTGLNFDKGSRIRGFYSFIFLFSSVKRRVELSRMEKTRLETLYYYLFELIWNENWKFSENFSEEKKGEFEMFPNIFIRNYFTREWTMHRRLLLNTGVGGGNEARFIVHHPNPLAARCHGESRQ